MSSLKEIATPVAEEFAQVKAILKEQISSQHRVLGEIAEHLLQLRGKMMRPLLTLLTAKLHSTPTTRTCSVAATFELIHNATLIHDDVIDEAYTRHNELTLGALLRSRSAVLVGDYLFSKGLTIASKAEAYAEIDIAVGAIEALVEGELRQSRNVRTLDVDRSEYFEVINLKTSSLIAAAAKSGAVSVGASEEQQQLMFSLGQSIGSAFQIQDDILDYVGDEKTGKKLYNDIKERKITLPLIMAMEVGGMSVIKDLRAGRTERVARFVEEHRGIDLAREECDRIIDRGISLLDSYVDCEAKASLVSIAHFAAKRDK